MAGITSVSFGMILTPRNTRKQEMLLLTIYGYSLLKIILDNTSFNHHIVLPILPKYFPIFYAENTRNHTAHLQILQFPLFRSKTSKRFSNSKRKPTKFRAYVLQFPKKDYALVLQWWNERCQNRAICAVQYSVFSMNLSIYLNLPGSFDFEFLQPGVCVHRFVIGSKGQIQNNRKAHQPPRLKTLSFICCTRLLMHG